MTPLNTKQWFNNFKQRAVLIQSPAMTTTDPKTGPETEPAVTMTDDI